MLLQIEDLLREPAILNISRLGILKIAKNGLFAHAIADWLHFCPSSLERDARGYGNAEGIGEEIGAMGKIRCLNIPNQPLAYCIEELLDRCIQVRINY